MRLFSMYSGIGAFEKALENLNIKYQLVGFSEIDKWAIESYCAIHNVSNELNYGDINKIDEKELPDFDLMTYGFPCQSFSVAGKRLGFEDVERGNLFFESMRIANYKKPKYLIAENVKGLVNHDKGETFKTVLGTLEKIGYNNYWKILNAKDYGMPQNRERVFIVSIRKDIDNGKFEFPEPIPLTTTFYDYLMLNGIYLEPDDYNKVKGLGATYSFGGYVAKAEQMIYSTITASYGKTSGNSMKFHHNNKYRYLLPIETWLLMGFDINDFHSAKKRLEEKFYVNQWRGDAQMYKQAGNSIVVPVLESIFRSLLNKTDIL